MSPLIKENITQSWKRVVSFTDFRKRYGRKKF